MKSRIQMMERRVISLYYVKWVWSHIRDIRFGFMVALLLMLLETSSGIATTFVQKYIIDDVFIDGSYDMLPLLLSIFAVSFLIHSIFFTAAPYRYVSNEYKMCDILLHRMLGRFFNVPMTRIQNERTARYVQILTHDLNEGGSLIGYHTPVGLSHLLHMLVLMGIVGWHSPIILLSITSISLLYIGVGHYFAKRMKHISRQVQDKRTLLAVHIEESISATREIIAYHRMNWEMKVYKTLFKDYFQSVLEETKAVNKQAIFSEPLQWAVTLSVLGFGGYQFFMGSMTLGSFVIVFQFTSQLMDSFQRVFHYVMDVSSKLAHVDRMRLLTEEVQMEDGELQLKGRIQSIRFDQVKFSYENGTKTVFEGLSLDIPVGSKVAFVGTSGGGKSTLAQLIVRFYDPINGTILINGMNLNRIQRSEWTDRVRIVFQDPYMMADTVRNNLLFGREGFRDEQLSEACRIAQIGDDIRLLPHGYEEEVGERGVQLSGGQKQRLAIARAILDDPEILILDEATSALDLETERKLQAQLDTLRRGKTTIVIAHRLSTVMNADLIFVMAQGKVAEYGDHDALMRNGQIYPSLVSTQG